MQKLGEDYINTNLSAALKEERELLEGSKDIKDVSEDEKNKMLSLLKGLFWYFTVFDNFINSFIVI